MTKEGAMIYESIQQQLAQTQKKKGGRKKDSEDIAKDAREVEMSIK